MEHQDWADVTWSKAPSKASAARSGLLDTEKKVGAGGNTQAAAGPSHAARVEEDSESFANAKVSLELKKLLQQERTKAGMTQKELATACNLKANIIQDYEAGKAIPNSMLLKKIERALKQKNPAFVAGTFTKAQKKAVDKAKAKKAAVAKAGAAKGPRAATAANAKNQAPKSRRF
ncbi:Multiprotein-bridging factor 1 [Hondaea fermentalgiana]|uniref:Multiprotein-bridging factor 1 n=1 Tax=Hondaea fermentalgiana TaxID=2315210 RepID=A0A2R5G623_9STRA|nr:Multiprotein-bridging factor 1 [Hondaea fermentalgiana]|eukprot:GBG25779.1 Multiprotein-bridging factor 1 [Hondaea fermentalgiana]